MFADYSIADLQDLKPTHSSVSLLSLVCVDIDVQDLILSSRQLCQISVLTWVLDFGAQSKPSNL